MKSTLRLLSLLLAGAAFGPPRLAQAQTPSLEFAASADNPTGNGPVNTDQVITFLNNTNNPTGNTFAPYAPTVTATFSLSNQQYTGQAYTPGTGVSFGATPVANSPNTTGASLFPLMNAIGLNGIATATANGYFTSTNGVSGGIDVTANSAVRMYTSVLPLPTPVPANQRYQYADLTITFNRTIANPVIQLVGLGGALSINNGATVNGFSTELDLLTTGVTLSKLAGSGELVVNTTGGVNNLGQINNGATNPNGTTGAGAASGSVLINTPATGINSVTFRVYLRPLAAGGQIHGDNVQNGDVWLIGVSSLSSADVATSISGPTTSVAGQTVTYIATTTNNGSVLASNNTVTVTLPSKPAANTVTIPSTATYDASTGIVTFAAADLATGATTTNSVSFVTQATPTSVSGVAASTSGTSDPNAANNNGSAANATVTTTVSPTGAAGTAANCATAGKDGAASLNTNPNAYYPSTAAQTLTGGGTTNSTITVGAARGATTTIAAGDLLLVVQMQGANITTTDGDSYGDGVAGGSANGTSVTTNFTAGTYEYVTVASVSNGFSATAGGTITLTAPLRNGYSNAVATATTGQRTFQVIRVPQYTNVTLTANLVPAPWNGSTGGIVALDVDGQLNLNNFTIDASGMGFRGGAGRVLPGDGSVSNTTYRSSASLNTGGTKGEGIAGTPRYVNDPAYAAANNAPLDTRTATTGYPTLLPGTFNDGYPSGDNGRGAPGNAGGGGTDANSAGNDQNSGGGGGANGGRGGRGGNSWSTNQPVGGEPGAAFPAASSSRLVLGGGGGSGSTNNGTGTPGSGFASSGAAGGGIVLVRTGTLTGAGSILANGAAANSTVDNDGSGGGGSGGSILVTVTNSQSNTASLTLTANGGIGGTNTGAGVSHGPGGGGGGGIILTNSVVAATATANGAANGTTVPGTIAYGAEAGIIGVGNPAISNTIANSTAGANCIADVASIITGPANANAGSTVTLTATFSNIGALAAAGTVRTVTLPAGVINPQAPGSSSITGTVATGYTITYPSVTLNPGTANATAFNITYVAPASGTVVANSNVTTNTSQGGLTANDPFSLSTAIGLVADVTTALTGPQTLTPGTPSGTYTASFTNEGPSTGSTVTRTVTLPAGATNIIVNGAAYTPTAANPNTIDFGTAATLNSGASNAFTFSFTPATTATGSLAITSNVSTTTGQGNNTAPDASTITAPVVPLANVATTLSTSTPSIAAGSSATGRFAVSFSNGGPSVAAGVVASVQLPTGLTNVSATNNPNGVYSPTTGVFTYPDVTSITNGGVVNSTITFDAPASGPVAASSAISTTTNEAGQTANNTATAAVTINPAFDLTTTLTGPATNVVGDLVTLAVTTTNNGPSPAPNAVQTVQLTSGLTNVYVSNGGVYNALTTTQSITSNGVTYSVPAGGVVFPTVASLPSGQTVANSISFAMPTTTGFAPTALVTPNTTGAGETNTANNTAALNNVSGTNLTNVNSQAGISNAYTTITTSTASTTVGSAVTLTVVTGNNGPNRATGVTQTVQILPGFTTATLQVNGITGTAGTNSITFGTNGPVYNTLTGLVTFPTLTDGANGSASATSVSNTITITPSAAVAATANTAATVATTGSNGQILAMATVRTTNTDPVPADNVASVGITLTQSADLATTITGPTTAQPGQAVTYTATFVNNGSMTANGVTETAQLPAGLGTNGVTITDGSGNAVSGASYNSTTGLVTFPTLTTNASGARQVFRLTFAAPTQGFTALSSISSVTLDAVATNNSAIAPTAVAAAADLATVVSGPATAVVGNPVTYTVTTTNNGPVTATNATTTLQLAANFSASTLQVNGTTGTANGNTITYNLAGGATATYTISTGLVTFPVVAGLPNGTSASNYVTFVMPSSTSTNGQTSGIASVSTPAGVDPVSGNNTASVATSVAPTTTTSADLVATVSASATSVAPGTTVTYTASYSNIGTDAATNVVPTLQLLPGLTTATIPLVSGGTGTANGNIITFSNGTTYNSTTGVVSFPPIASQAAGTSGNVSYTVQVVMPNNGPVLATASTTSNTSEPNTTAAQANNVQSAPVTITPSFNEVTSISGPTVALAGTSQTYTVTATNNGPSATSNPTTQTVTVPAGQTPTNITNNGVYSSTNNNITWTIPAGQGPGGSNAVANSFTIVQPTAGTTLNAAVAVTGESNGNDNAATITTAPLNLAPLAYAVVNTLQNPQSNEAGGLATGLLISPLNASDPENAFATQKYTIVAAPDPSQGTLYYSSNGTTTGTYTQVPVNPAQPLTLTQAQAQTLRFKAATGFVGNASFTYLTTDAASNLSPAVNYTIPVETDVDAVAYTITPTKGGSGSPTPYVAGDVIAFTTDANGAVYNATTSSVYTTTGTLQAGANNGIVAASVVAGSFTSSRAGITSLAGIGLVLDATGRIVVDAAPNTSKLQSGNYSVQILTTDGNGGQTTRTVSFNIPGNPLPVVLTAFTASAVQNRDAQLGWITASEVNSAYFDVERSLDGTTFTKVGQVAAQGTTAASTTYAFTDKGVASLTAGAVYYRLRQVDLDAKSSYSPVRTVSFTKATVATLSLYPNPAQNATGLDLSQLPASASYQVLLLDATGRQVRSATVAGGQLQPLNLTDLATGTYHVLVTGTQADGSALRQTLRLTKD